MPPVLPIDVTAIVAIIMVFSVVLVPIIGFTARFALKPLVEALSGFFERKAVEETVAVLERRMAFMEQQLEGLQDSVDRLAEVSDFHRELGRGPVAGREAIGPPPPDAG